jgi:hypothetical protein
MINDPDIQIASSDNLTVALSPRESKLIINATEILELEESLFENWINVVALDDMWVIVSADDNAIFLTYGKEAAIQGTTSWLGDADEIFVGEDVMVVVIDGTIYWKYLDTCLSRSGSIEDEWYPFMEINGDYSFVINDHMIVGWNEKELLASRDYTTSDPWTMRWDLWDKIEAVDVGFCEFALVTADGKQFLIEACVPKLFEV